MSAVAEFFELTVDEKFNCTQTQLARLARHRHSVRNERPSEKAHRQHIRAEELARRLGSVRPSVVRAMLALVQADEHTNPKGDPPPPAAPGARGALKPKTAKTPKAKSQPVVECSEVNTPQPGQIGFWE